MNLIVKSNGKLLVDGGDLKIKGVRQWVVETYASSINFGSRSSLANVGGSPGIAYISTGNDLRYAKRTAGVWTDELVLTASGTNKVIQTSLVELASGHPGIAYYYEADPGSVTSLRFATYDGVSWSHTTIVTAAGLVVLAGVQFCAVINGQPAVVYGREQPQPVDTQTNVYYARGGAWTEETVRAVPLARNLAYCISEVSGDAAVGYFRNDGVIGGAYYAERAGGTWPEELVDSQPVAGGSTPFALDVVNGNPSMYIYHSGGQGVRHAERISSVWTITQVFTGNKGQGGDIIEYLGEPRLVGNSTSIEEWVFNGSSWSAPQAVAPSGGPLKLALLDDILPVSQVLGVVGGRTFAWLFEGCCC